MKVPKFQELMNVTLKGLENLGGSGTIQEIDEQVVQILNLPDEITSILHNPEKSSRTELEYRLAWTKTYLKKYGLIENSRRGVWAFSEKYSRGMRVNPQQVVKEVRQGKVHETNNESDLIEEPTNECWREELHKTITSISPESFERLAKRILREIGFVQVEVTGKSGDGGIDGKGIVKLQNVLSYHVVFQCKRYSGSVGPSYIRDFRGAMVGRADKGLFITTGTFTRDALKEATRDGASPIDLIDGEELIGILKELELGVQVKMVEEISIDQDWFRQI
jgi:restriction system protein